MFYLWIQVQNITKILIKIDIIILLDGLLLPNPL